MPAGKGGEGLYVKASLYSKLCKWENVRLCRSPRYSFLANHSIKETSDIKLLL